MRLDSTCCISWTQHVVFRLITLYNLSLSRFCIFTDLELVWFRIRWMILLPSITGISIAFVCLFVSQGGTSVNCYLSLASLIGQLYLWPKSNQSNFPRLSFYGVTLLYFMASHVSDLHWEQECTPVFLLKISPFYSGHSSESRILYFQISIPALSQARPGCLFIQKPGGRD